MKQKRLIVTTVFSLIILISGSNAHGFTSADLMGEYSLVGFTIQYYSDPPITQDDASSFSGRLSVTAKAFVMEMDGYISGSYIYKWTCAFYTVSGSRIYAGIVGESSAYIDIQLSGDSLIASGSDYDDDGNYFTYIYTWKKNEVYYTQGQLDQAVSDLNQTLSERNQTISDLNDTIAQKDQTISALSEFNGDGILDLKDIIWGLQVLTGQR